MNLKKEVRAKLFAMLRIMPLDKDLDEWVDSIVKIVLTSVYDRLRRIMGTDIHYWPNSLHVWSVELDKRVRGGKKRV